MNLELPFMEHDAALDEHLAKLEVTVDALFLEAVDGELERLRAERAAGGDESAAESAA